MSLIVALLPPLPLPLPLPSSSHTHTHTHTHTNTTLKLKTDNPIPNHRPKFLPNLLSLALTLTLTTSPLPSHAIPSLNSSQSPSISLTTPFSQSKTLQVGLENGKIRPCPSINPGCVSTNPKSSSFSFPWMIPADSLDNAIQRLREAILNTQKHVKFQPVEDTLDGQYLQAEVDGGFDRDVLEFLVRGDVVTYRCMAAKVTYIYPFTTAFGDSKGQEARLKEINDQLGWFAPSFDSME